MLPSVVSCAEPIVGAGSESGAALCTISVAPAASN